MKSLTFYTDEWSTLKKMHPLLVAVALCCFSKTGKEMFLKHFWKNFHGYSKKIIYCLAKQTKAQGKRRILVEFNSSNLFILK